MPAGKISFILLFLTLTLSCRAVSGIFDQSGTALTIEVKSVENDSGRTTAKAVSILQNRLDALGVKADVAQTSSDRLEVRIYGARDLERIRPILLSVSKFELRKVFCPPNPAPIQAFPTEEAALRSLGGKLPADRKILPYLDRQSNAQTKWIVVEDPPIVDGNELRDARAYSASEDFRDYRIAFSLRPAGAQRFGSWTAANINNYLAVILNDEVRSVAYIKSMITDSGEISGNFTKEQAEDLALIMTSGYLAATLTLIDEKPFGK